MRILKMFISNMTIFPKLLFTFLLAIVPLFYVSLQMNRMGADSVREKILSSMETRVRSNLNSLEAEMERIMRLQHQYMVDEDLSKLSLLSSIMPYYDVVLMEKRVENKLRVLKNSNLFVSEARAYIPLIGKTILSLGYEEMMLPQEVRELQQLSKNQSSPFVYWQGKLVINLFNPNPAYSDSPSSYILQIEIDQQGLRDLLERMLDKKGEGAVLFNEKDEWMIKSSSEDQIQELLRVFMKEQPEEATFGQGTITFDNLSYYVSYEKSPLLNMNLIVYTEEDQVLGPLNKYRMQFWVFFGLSLGVVFIFSFWIYRMIHSPLRNMVRAFRKVEKGDLSLSIEHSNNDEFQYLYGQFNMMVSKLKKSTQDVYESRIMAQQSELKQLQSQINPHFLYNTYYVVHRMAIAHDVDNVVKATRYLGQYFRYITRNSSDEASLPEEWNHTVAYIEIQQMRFHSRIKAVAGGRATFRKTVRQDKGRCIYIHRPIHIYAAKPRF